MGRLERGKFFGGKPSVLQRGTHLIEADIPCFDLPVHPRRMRDVGVKIAVKIAGGGKDGTGLWRELILPLGNPLRKEAVFVRRRELRGMPRRDCQ